MKTTLMLKKNYEFKKVLVNGKYYSGKYIGTYIIPNRKNINMLGIAIGKKIANSVNRNRIKRLLRENYRLLETKIDAGYSIVFLWKKNVPIEKATFNNINEDMLYVFNKAKLMRG